MPRIGWTFSIVLRINDLLSLNNSSLLSACLNKEVMVWNRKYKALAALNSFLHLAISFSSAISFPKIESHPIILEMYLLFQFDKCFWELLISGQLIKHQNDKVRLSWCDRYCIWTKWI